MKKDVFMGKVREMECPGLYATICEDVTQNRMVAELRVVSALDSKFFKLYSAHTTAESIVTIKFRKDFIAKAKRYNRWIEEALAERSRI